METILTTTLTKGDLLALIKQGVLEVTRETEKEKDEQTVFTFKKAREITGHCHNKLRGMVDDGILKTTSDGKYITAQSLNDYLGRQ